jgi:threonine/homoserine/homoserine lactone efflux protein
VLLGLRALKARKMLAGGLGGPTAPKSLARIMREGFIVGLTNPKAIVIFTAVLPQFADRAAGDVPLQLIVFALIFVAIALVCDGAWAVAAGTARSWFARSPRRLETVGGAGGVILIGLGVRLALTGRRD